MITLSIIVLINEGVVKMLGVDKLKNNSISNTEKLKILQKLFDV